MTDYEDQIIIGAKQKHSPNSGLVLDRSFSLPQFTQLLLQGPVPE